MTDKPSNYELDDELLSAYLDGELSADERAAVEARLATDPAAQQLLHELRSVSQSVQALPTESLGRDLSDEIIRRARVVRGSPDPAPIRDRRSPSTPSPASPSRAALPQIRIFQSKRAWIWASMTLAAGLLIMIVQSGDESANKLPSVAARNQDDAPIQLTDEAAQSTRRDISLSAAPQSLSPSPATVASESEVQENQVDALGAATPAVPMSSEPLAVQMKSPRGASPASGPPVAAASPAPKSRNEVEKLISGLDDSSGTLTALPEQLANDKAAAPQPAGSISGLSGAPAMSAGKRKSESVVSPTPQRFLLVHVVATPDAIKKGSFDRLLADNKIEFVPQPAKKQSLGVGGGTLAKPAQSESRSNEQSDKAAETHSLKTEMVLVEAPAPAIESCLADLNKNASDFVSIAVKEGRQAQDRPDAKRALSRSLAETPTNLSRFSRGAVPELQKATIDLGQFFYAYDFDEPKDAVANGLRHAGGFGGEAGKIAGTSTEADGDKKWYDKDQPTRDVRRARSITTWGIDSRDSADFSEPTGRAFGDQVAQSTQAGEESKNRPKSQRKPNEQPEAKAGNQNNNLKVLFVFTPEEAPTPVAPSDNRPK